MSAIFRILLNFAILLSLFNFNPVISEEYEKCNNYDSLNFDKSVNYIAKFNKV